jgi:hypothetical protein
MGRKKCFVLKSGQGDQPGSRLLAFCRGSCKEKTMERWSVRPSSRALCHYSSKPLGLTVSQNQVSASARAGKPFTPDHIACCFSTKTNVIRAAVDCEEKASTFAREISSNARGEMKKGTLCITHEAEKGAWNRERKSWRSCR